MEIAFCFTFSHFNQDYAKEVYEFVIKELNCSRMFNVLIRGDTRNKKSKQVNISKYEEIPSFYNHLLSGREHSRIYYHDTYKTRSNILYKKVAEIYKKNQQLLPCYASILNAVISERGIVYPCEILRKRKKLGDLRKNNYDFNKIWRDKNTESIRAWIKKNRCFCTDETFIANNCRFSFKFYSGLFKRALRFER